MKIITIYEANDGRRFDTKESCEKHNVLLEMLVKANEAFKNGSTLYHALELFNYNMDYLSVKEKDILRKITKETGFKIEYWQCSEKPAYKVIELNVDGKIHIFGDAGSCRGPYGNWVSIRGCIRHYKHG